MSRVIVAFQVDHEPTELEVGVLKHRVRDWAWKWRLTDKLLNTKDITIAVEVTE